MVKAFDGEFLVGEYASGPGESPSAVSGSPNFMRPEIEYDGDEERFSALYAPGPGTSRVAEPSAPPFLGLPAIEYAGGECLRKSPEYAPGPGTPAEPMFRGEPNLLRPDKENAGDADRLSGLYAPGPGFKTALDSREDLPLPPNENFGEADFTDE
jgi:hypothetical protein